MPSHALPACLYPIALCCLWAALGGSPALAAKTAQAQTTGRVISIPERWPGRVLLKKQPAAVVDKVLREGAAVLRDGKASANAQPGLIRALVLFEQDADAVFELLTQTHRQDEYLPLVQSAKTIERYGSGNLDQHELEVLFVDLIFRVRHRWDAKERKISWSLDPSYDNDLRRMDGSWKIYPLEADRSIGEYASRVDIGRLLPDFVQQLLTRRDLPKALHAQRTWVNSGGD
jgi:ribosome-associated toxin RatA of RatAB toxin-antitoxin module